MIKNRSARMALLACAGVASLGLLVGPASAAAKAKKKTVTKTAAFSQCVSVASPILDADGPFASAVIPVSVPNFKGGPQDGVVTAITSAGIRIAHDFDRDLVLTLISPGGKVVTLANRRGDTGGGYGSGAASCGGSPVLFGDGFANPISSPGNIGDAPIVGNFKPEQPLNQVVGGPARGSWVLLVGDVEEQIEGFVNAFSLNFAYTYKALQKKKLKKK
jgi:hypothetical protein